MIFSHTRVSGSLIVLLCSLEHFVLSTPIRPNCDGAPVGQVVRMRDISDCTKFYYCVKGAKPLSEQCPRYPQSPYTLYFVPKTGFCDLSWKAPEECFPPPGNGTGSGVYVPEPTTTTTVATTTKAPRPPVLDDQPSDICTTKPCGLFANTDGDCGTYVVCVRGAKVTKKCNGGFFFDVNTNECQPAHLATCWTEPNAGPHVYRKSEDECPFHGNEATQPIETVSDGIILQSPEVTNWGDWQEWEYCPAGTYATGIYAWRRLLMQGSSMDHAGIVSFSFICQTPGGNETTNIIESLAPNAPHDGWPSHYMCNGAVVGIRLNSVAPNGKDEIATDNVQGLCSCSAPVYKPYEEPIYYPQSGNRGDWTTPQYCKKGQAVCGMQTQMQEYKEHVLGIYDNNGLNNMKVKCCDIPNPLDKCNPKEERLLVRVCDNSKSEYTMKCDFDAMVGLSLDYDTNPKIADFYTSIGYTFDDDKQVISKRIETRLANRIKTGSIMEYTWDDIIEPNVMGDAKISSKTLYVNPLEKLELFQIVGRCGHFLVRTNRYMRLTKNAKTGKVTGKTYFEI